MRAKILSSLVIVAICFYILFGLILQQPSMNDPVNIYSTFEQVTIFVSFFFSFAGLLLLTALAIRWVLKDA